MGRQLAISVAMRRITWLVPCCKTLHILSTGIVLSSVLMIDLRVWGASRSGTAIARSERFMPWIWAALAIATLTGIVLMLASPRSFRDGAFVAKLYLMAAADHCERQRFRSCCGGTIAAARMPVCRRKSSGSPPWCCGLGRRSRAAVDGLPECWPGERWFSLSPQAGRGKEAGARAVAIRRWDKATREAEY